VKVFQNDLEFATMWAKDVVALLGSSDPLSDGMDIGEFQELGGDVLAQTL
jgi:hypothetical protein